MKNRTCFVIMPIGDLEFGELQISQRELREKYDNLITEALLRADSTLDIKRADDVAKPGCITNDIVARIMFSDVVIADVTYPNPNVYYELGLRHACKPGTIIIRDESGPRTPFDIAHLRHIPYSDTSTGLKKLAEDLRNQLNYIYDNPAEPDNLLLDQAKLTSYRFMQYGEVEDPDQSKMELLETMLHSPELMEIALRKSHGQSIDQSEVMRAMLANPDSASRLFQILAKSGAISLDDIQLGKKTKDKRQSGDGGNKK